MLFQHQSPFIYEVKLGILMQISSCRLRRNKRRSSPWLQKKKKCHYKFSHLQLSSLVSANNIEQNVAFSHFISVLLSRSLQKYRQLSVNNLLTPSSFMAGMCVHCWSSMLLWPLSTSLHQFWFGFSPVVIAFVTHFALWAKCATFN